MPYNPGSAYPRKTVYVPPTEGYTSFQRAANAPDFTSQGSVGGHPYVPAGDKAFRAGNAAAARGADSPNAGGLVAMKQHGQGFLAQQAAKQAEARGRQAGQQAKQAGTAEPTPRPLPQQGDASAVQKRQAASQLADQMADQVLTGKMPGDTGLANIRPSRGKKTTAGQQTLF